MSPASIAWSFPRATPIHFRLTSGSVMTAFFVPQLGSMIYTMNRMGTQLHLLADDPGTFRGLATQMSGDGFADMHFEVVAKTAPEFYDWLGQARGAGDELTLGALYRAFQAERPAGADHVQDGRGRIV